jgi:hypothetical protein
VLLSSPETSVGSWEIWLWALGGHKVHVRECGSFGSEREAVRVEGLVRLWLHLGVWGAELDAAVPDRDDRLDLFALPDVLAGLGIDPRRTAVEATRADDEDTRYCDGGPNETADWTSGAVRADAGSAPAGPHCVRVKAERR